MIAEELSFEAAKVGDRVQDYWGSTGTIRWKGKLGSKDKPPLDTPGSYFFVEFDEEGDHPDRSDGTWNKVRYCTCPPRRGLMTRAHHFLREVNPKAIALLRKKFGEKVADWHDFELVKFSIARSFNMKEVIEMLAAHLEWRKKFLPSAEEYFPPEMAKDYPIGYSDYSDYDGNLIYCERPGNGGTCTPPQFVAKYGLPRIGRWHATVLEMGIKLLRESNYRNKRMTWVVDLAKLSAFNMAMVRYAKTLATVEQANYPENLGYVFLINCPTMMRYAWNMLKPFLDPRTNKKINFLAAGKAIEKMKQYMKEEYIPDFAGGPCSSWRKRGGVAGTLDQNKECTELKYAAELLESSGSPAEDEHKEFPQLDELDESDDLTSPLMLGASQSRSITSPSTTKPN